MADQDHGYRAGVAGAFAHATTILPTRQRAGAARDEERREHDEMKQERRQNGFRRVRPA
jgi:hypothetical protein